MKTIASLTTAISFVATMSLSDCGKDSPPEPTESGTVISREVNVERGRVTLTVELPDGNTFKARLDSTERCQVNDTYPACLEG